MSSSMLRLMRAARPATRIVNQSFKSIIKPSPLRSFATLTDSSFLNGSNAAYVDQQFVAWRNDPSSVHSSWNAYFATGQYQSPPGMYEDYKPLNRTAVPGNYQQSQSSDSVDSAKVIQLVRAFQVRGHLVANIDPLGILPPRPHHELLNLSTYGFSEADLDKRVDLSSLSADVKGFVDRGRPSVTLREIYDRLKDVYCGTIGYEYMHIPSVEKCNWIRERIETREKMVFEKEAKLQILDRLTWADHFERYLQIKWSSAKRFGLEGAESFIAGMKSMIGRSAELGVENIVIGMPHRGRLNVLNTVLRKNTAQIFAEFADSQEDDPDAGHGDVKYHLGMSLDTRAGKQKKDIHLSLVANPSHLETVDAVVLGKTRAKQYYAKDTNFEKSMGLLLHGDAAFAGQGIVYETMGFMDLEHYSTGGTIHIVVNNQVGFTTDPSQSRSSPYCTDIAKAYNLPVFHVNADDPEAVVHVCELAAEWRAKWHTDVVIDVVCYRKHGHNEIDEPMFTQPTMYSKIKNMKSTLEQYQARLRSEGITDEEIKAVSKKITEKLDAAYAEHTKLKHPHNDNFAGKWSGLHNHSRYSAPKTTGVPVESLREIGLKLTQIPAEVQLHSRLATVYKAREKTITEGTNVDWGTAESLAFGSLLVEGKHVRLSGQDVERGTFSHRHSVLHDQKSNTRYTPLNNLLPGKQAQITVTNSSLSEYGVLGFELGYSLENPQSLVIWEAQFGDFFNTAQVIVDQFIASGEDKWGRQTGLVMLLPHGYEGAGAEHSSARIERFLEMTNDDADVIPEPGQSKQIQTANWQCVNITTPANYFHALRRQLYRDFRKPLVVFSPKQHLRSAQARSSLEDMAPGTQFQRIIGEVDQSIKPEAVKRLVFCSGKVYYDIVEERANRKVTDMAVVRVEQLAPFPFHQVAEQIKQYPNAQIVWAQEEPKNMGAYAWIKDRIHSVAKQLCSRDEWPIYVGRASSASTAAGHMSQHKKELAVLMKSLFEPETVQKKPAGKKH